MESAISAVMLAFGRDLRTLSLPKIALEAQFEQLARIAIGSRRGSETGSELKHTQPTGFESSHLRQEKLRRRRTGCEEPLVSGSWCESGGETFVAVMQARNLRDGDNLSDSAWHNRA